MTVRSRRTALASPSLSRTRVPPGEAGRGSRGVRPALGLLLSGLVELVAQSLNLFVGDGAVFGLRHRDEFVQVVPLDLAGDGCGDVSGQPGGPLRALAASAMSRGMVIEYLPVGSLMLPILPCILPWPDGAGRDSRRGSGPTRARIWVWATTGLQGALFLPGLIRASGTFTWQRGGGRHEDLEISGARRPRPETWRKGCGWPAHDGCDGCQSAGRWPGRRAPPCRSTRRCG